MKKGIAYGVGVGAGDPEFMTLKAVRLIRENDVIAVPGKNPEESLAYQIAVQNVPELPEKILLPLSMPMTKNKELLTQAHQKNVQIIEFYLKQGKNVIYLTLGDSTIYCSFSYLQRILEADGYPTELVSGVSSFSAVAARLNLPLAEGDEQLHIIPSVHKEDVFPDYPGNYVLMKSGSHMKDIKEFLYASRRKISAVENCGMNSEKIYHSLEEIPDNTGYFSLIIAESGDDT